jgi:hypothetical protein
MFRVRMLFYWAMVLCLLQYFTYVYSNHFSIYIVRYIMFTFYIFITVITVYGYVSCKDDVKLGNDFMLLAIQFKTFMAITSLYFF